MDFLMARRSEKLRRKDFVMEKNLGFQKDLR